MIIEVMMRYYLTAHLEHLKDWDRVLPAVQSKINSSSKTSTGRSPYELMYGTAIRQSWNLLRRLSPQNFTLYMDADEALKFTAVAMKQTYDQRHSLMHFKKN